ncbi:MAG: DoxX family membrane protein [Proteobacteria bacterium]|nr:DoxX family membrane protein [Pseudomonadota bacterium]
MAESTSKLDRFMQHPAHSIIALLVRFYLAWVFISACLHKLADPTSFAIDIATYQMLPLVFINPLAIILPYVELGTGIMLITGTKARAAALMVCGMMIMFMIALSYALMHDLSISCGCFASNAAAASDPISWLTMLRDSAWLILGIYVVIFDKRPLGVDRWLEKRKQN